MSLIFNPQSLTEEDRLRAVRIIMSNSRPDVGFYLLVIGAALLAIGGIFMDSIPVLIASMIVAPLSYPILSLGLGVASHDMRLIGRSFGILMLASLIGLILAVGVTLLAGHIRLVNVFISFSPDWFLAAVVAVVAGCVAAYGMVSPKVSEALTGVAIAVSLMPPLVDTGIEFASQQPVLAGDAFILFLLNVLCIMLASACTFVLLGVRNTNHSSDR